MKINIQIEDASPEELQRLFAGAPEITFKAARPKIHEAFARMGAETSAGPILKMPVSIPAGPEDLGACKDCDNGEGGTFSFDRCNECAPAQKKEKPVKKAPKKTRGNKSNKFGIPVSLLKTDRKAYDRAWHYCNAHGITYDKIAEFKAAKKAERVKKPAKVKEPPTQMAPMGAIKIEGTPAAPVIDTTIKKDTHVKLLRDVGAVEKARSATS